MGNVLDRFVQLDERSTTIKIKRVHKGASINGTHKSREVTEKHDYLHHEEVWHSEKQARKMSISNISAFNTLNYFSKLVT